MNPGRNSLMTSMMVSMPSSELISGNDLISQALCDNEFRYRMLIEHIPAITYIAAMDEFSSTVYTSPQIERLLGFTQAEWMRDARLWFKQIHPDDQGYVLNLLWVGV
jgi:PAS domain-containing protein